MTIEQSSFTVYEYSRGVPSIVPIPSNNGVYVLPCTLETTAVTSAALALKYTVSPLLTSIGDEIIYVA